MSQQEEPQAIPGSENIFKKDITPLVLRIIAWLNIIATGLWFGFLVGKGFGNRFDPSVAVGAIANASEKIWISSVFFFNFISALLLFVVASLREIREHKS